MRLDRGWELARLPADQAKTPSELVLAEWVPAIVPGTVFQALAKDPHLIDRTDHWYRVRFPRPEDGRLTQLAADGLATHAELWLNGELILSSSNMFLEHLVEVVLEDENELLIRFRALSAALAEHRGRPRFITRLVQERNLRFGRTTLIGRSSIGPAIPPVGPWREVRLQRPFPPVRVATGYAKNFAQGVAQLEVDRPEAKLSLDGRPLELRDGRAVLEDIEPWWPHTHGNPRLYTLAVELDGQTRTYRTGFRALTFDPEACAFTINGTKIFCRGANWTPLDPQALHADPAHLRAALEQARDAGMNMLRVNGVFTYESPEFHALCDELGILVWQDFMFARMDYPRDEVFLASCAREAQQLVDRLATSPSLAVFCGNTEVAQQAAMMGLDRAVLEHPLFDTVLPAIVHPHPYVSSSPSNGALPFHVSRGPSHYFGVGAYRRPLEDARLNTIGFASECLAFANLPDGELDPKRGAARDPGASWDFADITEHYLEQLFAVNARELRTTDPERYAAMFRATTCELMERTQHLWRRKSSTCHGALIWFLRDLEAGAGWGVLDVHGAPKAAYFGLKRAWSPRAVWITDEGLNGLEVHVESDRAATLELRFYRADGLLLDRAHCHLEPGQHQMNAEALLGKFIDASYAYRFGPPSHALVYARLSERNHTLSQAFFHPLGLTVREDSNLSATATLQPDGSYAVTARAERAALFVTVEAPGFTATDNYFGLAPNEPWTFQLLPAKSTGTPAPLRAKLRALGASIAAPIRIEGDT